MSTNIRTSQLVKLVIIYAWLSTLFTFIMFIGSIFLMYILPDIIGGYFLTQKYFDLRYIVLFLLVINSIGYISTFFLTSEDSAIREVISPISLLFKTPLSILFGYFIWISFSFFNMLGTSGLLFLITIIFLQLISFNFFYIHSFPIFHDFIAWVYNRIIIHSTKIIRTAQKQMRLLLLMALVLSMFAIVLFVTNYRDDKIEKWLRDQFYVESVIPSDTMHAELVTITGYNFGWPNSNIKWSLKSTSGELIPQVWTDTKITFVVPLHLKEGQQYIWIQRAAKNDPLASVTEESNRIPINVVSRFKYYPEIGDSMFQKIWKRILLHIHKAYILYKL